MKTEALNKARSRDIEARERVNHYGNMLIVGHLSQTRRATLNDSLAKAIEEWREAREELNALLPQGQKEETI